MKKLLFTLLWVICFMAALLVTDQFLLRFPVDNNIVLLSDFQHFYRDFRHRLFHTVTPQSGRTAPAPRRATARTAVPAVKQKRRPTTDAPHYIYLDDNNTINFASDLDEIPARLRPRAKKLDN